MMNVCNFRDFICNILKKKFLLRGSAIYQFEKFHRQKFKAYQQNENHMYEYGKDYTMR